MDRAPRRVVVTGLGVITPIGIGASAFWEALLAGQNGVRRIETFDPSGLTTTFGGEVRGYDAKKFVPSNQRKNLKIMARDIQLAVGTAKLAFEDAGLFEERGDPNRFGVEFGASMISSDLDELAPSAKECAGGPQRFDYKHWGTHAMGAMPPLWMLKYLPNMPACHVSILYDLHGPNNSLTQSEAAGTLAIGEAFRIISRGAADVMLAGGCDSRIHPLALVRLALLGVSSRRNDAPGQACRPFDADRDGLVPAEGAGVVILEELEHAQNRGARILAELAGFGAGCDAVNADRQPDGSGIRIAIQAALRDARLNPPDIGYYNAHGVSTVEGDRAEARALRAAIGEHALEIPVSAHKSNMGNSVAACGAIEFVAGVLALQHGVIPPTINYQKSDAECPLSIVTGSPRELKKPSFLSANATRLGQAAALVARKFEG